MHDIKLSKYLASGKSFFLEESYSFPISAMEHIHTRVSGPHVINTPASQPSVFLQPQPGSFTTQILHLKLFLEFPFAVILRLLFLATQLLGLWLAELLTHIIGNYFLKV